MKKETLYVDVDDDITGIIDRVVSSKESIVAAVLPKRADMLHSSVNMRLLKKAADEAGKRLVLITSEPSVLKLAALTQVHVAKSLTSKPSLQAEPDPEVPDVITAEEAELTDTDKKKSVGELSGNPADNAAEVAVADDVIELDNIEDKPPEDTDKPKKLSKKDKKLQVPSFDKFRKRLFIFGGLSLALIIFFIMAIFVWPRATIAIETATNDISTELEFTATTASEEFDEEKRTLPAELKQNEQTLTEKFAATGSKDLGNKASGTITLRNCTESDNEITLPAGSAFSSGGFTFVSDEAVTLPSSIFTGGGTCLTSTRTVSVTAQNGGDSYNLSPRDYSAPVNGVRASGSAMSGGTTRVVKVVSAQDIAAAKQKILARNTDEYRDQVVAAFKNEGKFALLETFTAREVSTTSQPRQDEEADEATLSVVFSYRMLGVKLADVEKILANFQEDKIDSSKERIYNNGLERAAIRQLSRPKASEAKMSVLTTATAGPQLDAEAIAREVAGKSGGQTKQIIESRPGISGVDVRYDPFWVFSTPKKLSRIQITFDAEE